MTRYLPRLTVTVLLMGSMTFDVASASPRPSRSREWLERAWQIRYVLFIDSVGGMRARINSARKLNNLPEKPGRERVYLDAEELFEPMTSFNVAGKEAIALVVIPFDLNGRVVGAGTQMSHLVGKRNLLDVLVLTRSGSKTEKPYYFANWWSGIPGDVTFSPAVCTTLDSHLYGANWERDSYIATFGCREWTAQLYNRDRPYIDVTSYTGHGNFIGQLVGWSRFEDSRKPVIGLHGKTWFCLHECPSGEMPGVISDIDAWTAKHGYPVPQRAPQQPLYPDSKYKDDLNEVED